MKKNHNKPARHRKKHTPAKQAAPNFASLGKTTVMNALALNYALTDKDTPAQARFIIKAALAYTGQPFEAITGMFPNKFVDAVGVINATASVVADHIKPKHRQKAEKTFENTAWG